MSQGQGKGRPLRIQNVLRHQCASGVLDGDVLPMPACQLRYHGGADAEPRTRRQRKIELHVDCVALIEFGGMLCGNTLVINAYVEHAGCQEVEVWAGRGELCGSHGSIMVRVDRQPRFDVAPGERQVRCQLGRAQTQARQDSIQDRVHQRYPPGTPARRKSLRRLIVEPWQPKKQDGARSSPAA